MHLSRCGLLEAALVSSVLIFLDPALSIELLLKFLKADGDKSGSGDERIHGLELVRLQVFENLFQSPSFFFDKFGFFNISHFIHPPRVYFRVKFHPTARSPTPSKFSAEWGEYAVGLVLAISYYLTIWAI